MRIRDLLPYCLSSGAFIYKRVVDDSKDLVDGLRESDRQGYLTSLLNSTLQPFKELETFEGSNENLTVF